MSVWGPGTQYISSSFSRQREFMHFVTIFTPRHHLWLIIWRTSLPNPTNDLAADFHSRGCTILLRPCFDSLSILSGTGISTSYPSPTAFALGLGPDLLWVVQPSPENLGHSTALIVSTHRQPGCWLRSSHSLKECVIAHWSSDPAPKI